MGKPITTFDIFIIASAAVIAIAITVAWTKGWFLLRKRLAIAPTFSGNGLSEKMTKEKPLRTRFDWIGCLEASSSVITKMNLRTSLSADKTLNTDAFNFANSPEHNKLIVRGIEALTTGAATPETIKALLTDIIGRDTYGKFSEFAVYEWLLRRPVRVSTQIEVPPSELLGSHSVILDGMIEPGGICFDVKAFGFNGLLANRLKELLEKELTGWTVFIEDTWDISTDQFQALIQDARKIAVQLRANKSVRLGKLLIRIAPPRPVSISSRSVNAYALAKENALYPFTSANQFTCHAPFLLVFVLHPWLNKSAMGTDFVGGDTAFTRALARRAFMQFANSADLATSVCSQVKPGVTIGEASKLLSAILFLNAWPSDLYAKGSRESEQRPSWMYLNPRATHKISYSQARQFVGHEPNGIAIDDFADDDY